MKKTIKKSVKFKKSYKWALLLCLSLPMVANAQFINEWDWHDPSTVVTQPKTVTAGLNSENGLVHTPKGALKVLLIFAEFDGNKLGSASWPVDSMPKYSNVFYPNSSQFGYSKTDLSLSNFYYQMSKNSANPFKMIGTIFPEVLKIPQPTTTPVDFGKFTKQVFDSIEKKYPNYSWGQFDTRTNNPNFASSNVTSAADNEIDYIVISFRWDNGRDPWSSKENPTYMLQTHSNNGASAVAGILRGDYLPQKIGDYTFSTGYTVFKGMRDEIAFKELFLHEFAHNLYDSPHYNGANGVVGNHFYASEGWGMMDRSTRKRSCALGWEQWWLGWNNITYDLSSAANNGTYTLSDLIESGNIMRLKIPNTDQYLWLEFHAGTNAFDKRNSFYVDANNKPMPLASNGLFAYVENMGKEKTDPYLISSSPSAGANAIKFINGGGNYDFSNSSTYVEAPELWGNKVWNMNYLAANNFGGQSDIVQARFDQMGDGIISHTNAINAPGWAGGNEMHPILKVNNAFTYKCFMQDAPLKAGVSYSISSNPALIEHQNYYSPDNMWIVPNGIDTVYYEYYYKTDSLSPIRLHGLKITVTQVTSTSAKVFVQYDYNKIDGSPRWTGNIELPQNQYLQIGGYSTVTINRTATPSRETPDPVFGFYPYSRLVLKTGSTLDISTYGTLLVKEKSTLEFENGSDLNVTGGNLTVDADCKLIFNTGNYEITNNGTINLNGSIQLNADAHLTIKGSGITNINGSVFGESGATITFEGINQNTTMLKIEKLEVSKSTKQVTLKNGKILMNNTNAEIYIKDGLSNVTIDNVKVTTSTGSNNGHEGIDIRSRGNVIVKNSTFENGMFGLYTYRLASSPALIVENCNFNNCTYGMYINQGTISVSGCTYSGNGTIALNCAGMVGSSIISGSTFNNNTNAGAISFSGYSGANLTITRTTATNNKYGYYMSGPVTLNMNCSKSINSPNYYGVSVNNNASANITTSDLSGNKYAIEGGGYSESTRINVFNINDGYNNLVKGSYTGSLCMYGYFYGQSTSTVSVNNNNWKTGAYGPIFNTDYKLYKTSSTFITLSDNSPEYGFSTCSGMKSVSISEISDTEPFLLNENTYRNVKTSLGTLYMDEAISVITNTNKKTGKNYEPVTQFKLLSELLLNNLNELNEAENELVKYAYRLFKEQFGKLNEVEKAEWNSTEEALKVIRKLQKDIEKVEQIANRNETSPDMFINIIDEANMLRYLQNYDAAIALLEKNMANLAKDDACYFEEQICITKAEKQMADNDYNGVFESLTMNCACITSRKSGDIENIASDNPTTDDYSLTIIPNPISNASEIKVCGYEGAELTIYNSSGQSVINEIVASDNYTKTISKNELGEGVYMVVVIQHGNTVLSEKIVVVK